MVANTHTSTPALWPTVPDDATFASVIESVRRYTGTPANMAARRFLGLNEFQGALFAPHAKAFAERIPGEKVVPETIVLRHTPFKLYSSFLTPEDENRWLSAIVDCDGVTARTFAPPTRVGRLEVDMFRQCRVCVEDDERRFGIGHWHVAHQIPALRRCPWHQTDIHDRCADCGTSLGGPRLLTMPGDPCRNCGSLTTGLRTPYSPSSGYAAMEALVMRALTGNAPELRPAVRMALIDRVIHRRTGTRGLPEVLRRFLTTWSIESPLSLGEQLGCAVTESKLLGLFAGLETATARTLQIAVISFVLDHATAGDLATCTAETTPFTSPESLFLQESVAEPDPELLRAFCSGAVTFGYPVEGARALAAGAKARFIAAKGLAAPNVTRRFVSRFSTDVQKRYEEIVKARSERRFSMPLIESDVRPAVRNRILCVMKTGSTTREELNGACQRALLWANRFDSEWLDAVVPKRTGGRRRRWLASDRPLVRAMIVDAINGGVRTRRELKDSSSSLYDWALGNDLEWLDATLPALRRERGKDGCIAWRRHA